MELRKRRRDRQDAGGNADGDGERVVDQERRRGDQTRIVSDVLLGDDVRAAAGRVGVDRLTVREGDDGEQCGDDQADRDRVDERAEARDHEGREDEVGGVGDRRQGVGGQHRQAGDARQALVVGEVRWNRLADKEALDRKRGAFRHSRALIGGYARRASVYRRRG